MSQVQLKTSLIDAIKSLIQEDTKWIEGAMADAQEEANCHKGAMVSRYDTFKEEAQYKKDAYGKQLEEVMRKLSLVSQISTLATTFVQLGSVVETNEGLYFISTNVSSAPLVIEGNEYVAISLASPLGKILKGRIAGDIVVFRDRSIVINAIQ